jgi:hypothetical protein
VTKVEGNLFAWHLLYVKLQDARMRLKQSEGADREQLKAEVIRLQQESDSQLEAVTGGHATAKPQASAPR